VNRLSERTLRRVATGGFLLVVALSIVNPVLGRGVGGQEVLRFQEASFVEWGESVFCVLLATSALLILWFRPRHSVGWVLLATGLIQATCTFGQVYGARAYAFPAEGLPGGLWALELSAGLWLLTVFLPATAMLLRYPTGEIRGRWARRVDRAVLVGLGLVYVGYATSPHSVTDVLKGHEPPLLLPPVLAGSLMAAGALVVVPGAVFSVVHTLVRTWRASYPERQQLAWLVTVTPVAVAMMFLPFPGAQKLFWGIPLAVVVGVLRYRLAGIEVVVRRTLLYGSLTALVLLVLVATTAALTSVVPSGPTSQLVAAVVVAVGLVPVRDRLQRVVDRFVYGDSGDPVRALSRLADPLAAAEDVVEAVVETVAQGLRAPGAAVVVDGRPAAAWGEVGEDAVVTPLAVAGEQVGELRVALRSGEKRARREDRELLDAVAPFVAAVVRSVDLAQQVQVEQQRVVAATEAERSRLRHDLHDGLGPSLTGIGLGLEAAQSADPDRAAAILTRLRQEVAAALDEVRRIIDDLHPGALEQADLLSLLRAKAEDLTSGTPVRVTVDAPDDLPPLPPEVEGAAWRVVEEALTNVVRHAGATSCRVTLHVDEVLRLEVVDDGRGYAGPREGGVGLGSMELRATRLGGRFGIAAADPGTRVTLELPLPVPA